MTDSLFPHRYAGRAEEAKVLEAFETPGWCAEAILRRELLTPQVIDPCCGHGILSAAARRHGYDVLSYDIADWGYRPMVDIRDFLTLSMVGYEAMAVLMNPPFSKAVEFVEHAWSGGVHKIVCFQRFAWWESLRRASFWNSAPPNRVYICRERATSWRFDIPPEERACTGTPTAHAWFVWERGHPPGTLLGHLDRSAP